MWEQYVEIMKIIMQWVAIQLKIKTDRYNQEINWVLLNTKIIHSSIFDDILKEIKI